MQLTRLTSVLTITVVPDKRQWPSKLFFNPIDLAAWNAYTVWTAFNPLWHQGKSYRRRLFLQKLTVDLTNLHMERRSKYKSLHINIR